MSNVAGHLGNGVSEEVLQRAFEYWRNIDNEIGERIEKTVRSDQRGQADQNALGSVWTATGTGC